MEPSEKVPKAKASWGLERVALTLLAAAKLPLFPSHSALWPDPRSQGVTGASAHLLSLSSHVNNVLFPFFLTNCGVLS